MFPVILFFLCASFATGQPHDAFWNITAERSIFFYDSATDALYMYPRNIEGRLAYLEPPLKTAKCHYAPVLPTSIANPPPGLFFKQSVGELDGSAVTWGESIMSSNAPNGSLSSQQSLFIENKRILFVLGSYSIWNYNNNSGGIDPIDPNVLESCTQFPGWSTNTSQCMQPHRETYIMSVDSWNWTTVDSFPNVSNAALMQLGAYAMFPAFINLAYNPNNDRVYAFGGYLAYYDDDCAGTDRRYILWEFSFHTLQWTVVPAANPLCVAFASSEDPLNGLFVYNPIKNQLVTYSGCSSDGAFASLYCFVFDFASAAWSGVSSCQPFSGPSPAYEELVFVSPDNTGVYIMGGRFTSPGYAGQTFWCVPSLWFLDFATYEWQLAALPTNFPSGTQLSGVKTAMDFQRGVVYLWGGLQSTFSTEQMWSQLLQFPCEIRGGGLYHMPDYFNVWTQPFDIYQMHLPQKVGTPVRSEVVASYCCVVLLAVNATLAMLALCGGTRTTRHEQVEANDARIKTLFPTVELETPKANPVESAFARRHEYSAEDVRSASLAGSDRSATGSEQLTSLAYTADVTANPKLCNGSTCGVSCMDVLRAVTSVCTHLFYCGFVGYALTAQGATGAIMGIFFAASVSLAFSMIASFNPDSKWILFHVLRCCALADQARARLRRGALGGTVLCLCATIAMASLGGVPVVQDMETVDQAIFALYVCSVIMSVFDSIHREVKLVLQSRPPLSLSASHLQIALNNST